MADQIVIGPGSLYTSVISALKVNMLAPAIMGADGQKVFILNLVTQDGETLGMTGADHLTALSMHAGISGPGIVISHDRDFEVPEGHERVTLTVEEAAALGWRVIYADLVDEWAEWPVHDPLKLGQVLEQLTTDATGQ